MRPAPPCAVGAALLLLAGCASRPAAGPGPGTRPAAGAEVAPSGPEEVLARFAGAVDAGRWDEAWPLLSARWRAVTTPALLARDLAESGPVGPEAVARVRALLAGGARVAASGERATLGVGEGLAARLIREEGAWRVDALE